MGEWRGARGSGQNWCGSREAGNSEEKQNSFHQQEWGGKSVSEHTSLVITSM